MDRFCGNCGTKADDKYRFCARCDKELEPFAGASAGSYAIETSTFPAGTFLGELQRGWQRLLRLPWRRRAVMVVFMRHPLLPGNQRPAVHASYQGLLDGQPSPTLEARMEDASIAFRLLRIIERPEAGQKRLAVTIAALSHSGYSPDLSCELGFANGAEDLVGDAEVLVGESGAPKPFRIPYGSSLTVRAEFLVPETARPTFLDVKLDGGGYAPLYGWQEVRFAFDP